MAEQHHLALPIRSARHVPEPVAICVIAAVFLAGPSSSASPRSPATRTDIPVLAPSMASSAPLPIGPERRCTTSRRPAVVTVSARRRATFFAAAVAHRRLTTLTICGTVRLLPARLLHQPALVRSFTSSTVRSYSRHRRAARRVVLGRSSARWASTARLAGGRVTLLAVPVRARLRAGRLGVALAAVAGPRSRSVSACSARPRGSSDGLDRVGISLEPQRRSSRHSGLIRIVALVVGVGATVAGIAYAVVATVRPGGVAVGRRRIGRRRIREPAAASCALVNAAAFLCRGTDDRRQWHSCWATSRGGCAATCGSFLRCPDRRWVLAHRARARFDARAVRHPPRAVLGSRLRR